MDIAVEGTARMEVPLMSEAPPDVATTFWLVIKDRVFGEIGPERLIPWPFPVEYVKS